MNEGVLYPSNPSKSSRDTKEETNVSTKTQYYHCLCGATQTHPGLLSLDHKKRRKNLSCSFHLVLEESLTSPLSKSHFKGYLKIKLFFMEPLAHIAFMLMYHDNLFLFPNEGWRCIHWSFWGHWLTDRGMWHMFYIALISSSAGTLVLVPSHSLPPSLLTLLLVRMLDTGANQEQLHWSQ